MRPACASPTCRSRPTASLTSSPVHHDGAIMSEAAASTGVCVTIVTQTRVRAEAEKAFAAWQDATSHTVAGFQGFLQQTVMPPSPPAQVDWVILQRFADIDSATAWLRSSERQERLAGVRPLLIGQDDVHIVRDGTSHAQPAPVSVVISTRIKPGCETAYRAWELRIAAAQTRAPGFQGYRFEPPIKGVQDDWLSVLRFDSEANLQKWLASPERLQLIEEAKPFTEEFHARVARAGFEQWFQTAAGKSAPPPAWKQNLIVLLVLYPVVFLFGTFVQTPLLSKWMGLPFAVALFAGNAASVIILNYLVPWSSLRFSWWLEPTHAHRTQIDIAGTVVVSALCLIMVLAFWRLF